MKKKSHFRSFFFLSFFLFSSHSTLHTLSFFDFVHSTGGRSATATFSRRLLVRSGLFGWMRRLRRRRRRWGILGRTAVGGDVVAEGQETELSVRRFVKRPRSDAGAVLVRGEFLPAWSTRTYLRTCMNATVICRLCPG